MLDAIVDRMHRDGRFNDLGPDNTTGRRKAEALVEMAKRASGSNPDQPNVHPDIVVIVPVEHLLNPEPDPFGPPAEIIGTGPVDLHEVFRLALLGSLSLMTIDGQGRPLNLGRKQRLASCDQWIAISFRDHGCVIPGCDRPAAWCNAHHVIHWEHGGPTDLENLCLLCTRHHHALHDQHWTLHHHPDRTWQLTRADGTTVDPPRYAGNQRPPRAQPPD